METSIAEMIENNDILAMGKALLDDPSLANANEGFDQPIHIAAGDGKVEIVELLLRHGGNVNAKDEDGRTPLHRAAQLYPDVVRVLLQKGADPNGYDNNGYTPIAWAILGQQPEGESAINQMRAAGARYGLLEAAAMGDLPAVESILSNDPSAIANVPSTQTLLSLACLDGRYGKPQDRVEIVKLLLAHKLDLSTDAIASHISACDNYGMHAIADLLRAYSSNIEPT